MVIGISLEFGGRFKPVKVPTERLNSVKGANDSQTSFVVCRFGRMRMRKVRGGSRGARRLGWCCTVGTCTSAGEARARGRGCEGIFGFGIVVDGPIITIGTLRQSEGNEKHVPRILQWMLGRFHWYTGRLWILYHLRLGGLSGAINTESTSPREVKPSSNRVERRNIFVSLDQLFLWAYSSQENE